MRPKVFWRIFLLLLFIATFLWLLQVVWEPDRVSVQAFAMPEEHRAHMWYELGPATVWVKSDIPLEQIGKRNGTRSGSLAVRPEDATTEATIWDALAACESGTFGVLGSADWSSTVGLYEGGLQFHPATWDGYRDPGDPSEAYRASRSAQIRVAERVLVDQGWGAWPACARKLGLR